jgi:hypothetical protein
MDLTLYVTKLEDALSTAAAAGDEQTRRTAALLAAAVEPAARLSLMHALSDLAADVTAALDDRLVELTLEGGDVKVSVSGRANEETDADDDEPPLPAASGELSRITLRLPEELKTLAERAAAAEGVSLNPGFTRVIRDGLRRCRRPGRDDGGHTLRGWVRA